ncbi:MAG TPA: hypothetical protein VKI19_10525, partial [Acidimicrobiales bacterium]|nr:hypothetical protein [Acidimicrobiales bacterium]
MTDEELELLVAGRHRDPHRFLGLHEGIVRVYRPGATAMRLVTATETADMKMIHPAGVFEGRLDLDPGERVDYELEAGYEQEGSESTYRFGDPYRS